MRRRSGALGGALVLATFAFVAACGTSAPTCDCADSAITISIPPDIAASVSAPQLSGAACTNVTATCTNPTGGCSQYQFQANAAGTCHIVVPTGDTTFTTDITITASNGCCGGYYASPTTAADIEVPEPAAPEDGGAG